MLTATISNITGGTFTINVNNTEAHNYVNLYYYVNDILVYSGTESSYTVTSVNGEPITDNTLYTAKVLSEPFSLSFTTGTGDNVDSWLACIGNTNEQEYTLDDLDELFANDTLIDDLCVSDEAMNYLCRSTEFLLPKFKEVISSDDRLKNTFSTHYGSKSFTRKANPQHGVDGSANYSYTFNSGLYVIRLSGNVSSFKVNSINTDLNYAIQVGTNLFLCDINRTLSLSIYMNQYGTNKYLYVDYLKID